MIMEIGKTYFVLLPVWSRRRLFRKLKPGRTSPTPTIMALPWVRGDAGPMRVDRRRVVDRSVLQAGVWPRTMRWQPVSADAGLSAGVVRSGVRTRRSLYGR